MIFQLTRKDYYQIISAILRFAQGLCYDCNAVIFLLLSSKIVIIIIMAIMMIIILTSSSSSSLSLFFKVSFNSPVQITGIATQGRADYNQWVKSYTLSYSEDGKKYSVYSVGGRQKVRIKICYIQLTHVNFSCNWSLY